MNSRRLIYYFITPPKYFSLSILVILCIFHLRFGLIPAWQKINSDFPNYYTSSRLFIEGKDLSNIYNNSWFQNEINVHGINELGKFSPFPPPTVFVMLPEAFFNPLTAKRVFLVLNLIALVFGVYLLTKISNLNFIVCFNFVLLSGAALVNNILLGQLYLFLLIFIILGYYMLGRQKEILSGAFWGIGAAVKYFPLIFILVLIYNKKWKSSLYLVASVVVINIISFIFIGFETYRQFLGKIFINHLNGELSGQSKFAIQFQSWNSLLRNIFIYDSVENKTPLINSLALFNLTRGFIYLLFLAIAVFVIIKIKRDQNYFSKSIALSCLLMFVLSPASASYHLLLLVFPTMLLISDSVQEEKYGYGLMFIFIYFIIGFAPFIIPRLGLQSLVILYYRLWLTIAFYISTVWYMLSGSKNNIKTIV